MFRAASGWFPLFFLSVLVFLAAQSGEKDLQRQLWHHRNLGKAFYENPTTQYEAVEEFEKALKMAPDSARERLNYGLSMLRAGRVDDGVVELEKVQDQAPEIPHTWFNLGIVFKKKADYRRALAQFEKMAELVPDEPITRYNLGVLYRLTGEPERALQEFELCASLDPNLAGPHFQLYNGYRAAGRNEEAAAQLQIFNELKKRQAGAAIPEDLEWSYYSEVYDVIEPRDWGVPAPFEASFQSSLSEGTLQGEAKGLAVLDADGSGKATLLAWSDSQVLFIDATAGSSSDARGLEGLQQIVSIQPGDINNDGLPDLCVLTRTHPLLYVNDQGRFKLVEGALPAGVFRASIWLDFDHDSDIDLFLLGSTSALMRNNGEAGFGDHSEHFPFLEDEALAGTAVDLIKDTNGSDLIVIYRGRPAVLYRDRLGGNYEVLPQSQIPPRITRVFAQDVNNDGWTDLLALGDAPLLLLNREGSLEASSLSVGAEGSLSFADLGNRGWVDLVQGATSFANLGLGRFAGGQQLASLPGAVASVSDDFDFDGRPDVAVLTDEGRVHLLKNRSEIGNGWIQIGLNGVRNARLAPGAEVEVKAGLLYQKKIYSGVPLHFGLGSYDRLDTVRITWPNGLIQNELEQPLRSRVEIQEAQRLSGSCPMIFTWNGERFEFITDVLGVAPLGASSGDGEYFPVDHDEYVSISEDSLVEKDGAYEIRITEELREVSYLDQIRLIAVDQPSDLTVYTNEKFKGPPFPRFRLFGIREKRYPQTARDERGQDVLERVLKLDRTYPDSFPRDYTGVAEPHALELDFGSNVALDNRSVLVLSGWVDWADGSTFLRSVQESGGLVMPHLQVINDKGEWETVIEDMGLPAGKPKTIVVDLTDKFLSSSRRVRIVTSLCIYWDEIFLSEETGAPPVRLTEVPLQEAGLKFRGFSTPVIHPERKQPEAFDYHKWMPLSMWNPTPGMYTRYGPVLELVKDVDDRFVIMGSGDELKLLFDSSLRGPVQAGFKRTFLLHVDGWAKDGDLNTAYSTSVEPLPFHDMSRYPYPADEHYPDGEVHRLYLRQYNTRPALHLIRPLTSGSDRAGTARRVGRQGR